MGPNTSVLMLGPSEAGAKGLKVCVHVSYLVISRMDWGGGGSGG